MSFQVTVIVVVKSEIIPVEESVSISLSDKL
jgi:hypothetical protein